MTTPDRLSNPRRRLPLARAASARLGVLSIHLDGQPCRVGCEFCYLGARAEGSSGAPPPPPDTTLLEEALSRLDYAEVAVAVSEPAARWVRPLRAIVRAAAARELPVAVTTTAAVLAAEPGLLDGVARVNLSIDPRKGPVSRRAIERVARATRAPGRELALIVTLVNERFAASLLDGGLAALLAIAEVDRVALSSLKPPPPWCNTAWWLAACARLAPLLREHLDRRLFLDCWVAARVLRLGDCPARPDLSPGREFRACVYQPAPDFTFRDAADLAGRLADFRAPAACPFPVDGPRRQPTAW